MFAILHSLANSSSTSSSRRADLKPRTCSFAINSASPCGVRGLAFDCAAVTGVPTANPKQLTATANRLIVDADERSLQIDLVRLDRNIPTAGCVASRDPCPSTSTHRAAAQIPEAIGVR
jgi:hypothetical protein